MTAYRTHWFGLQYDSDQVSDAPTRGLGALRTVSWADGDPVGDAPAQAEFQALVSVTGDMIDRGVFTYPEAVDYMSDKLREWTGPQHGVTITVPAEYRLTKTE